MDRRTFLRNGCFACAALAATGTLLSSCQTMTVVRSSAVKDEVRVSIAGFTDKSNSILVRAKELEYDILLIRLSEKEYRAILMQCTHQDNPLVATSSGLFCNSHGSRFDLEGNVQAGPAIRSLKLYKTSLEGDQVVIHLS